MSVWKRQSRKKFRKAYKAAKKEKRRDEKKYIPQNVFCKGCIFGPLSRVGVKFFEVQKCTSYFCGSDRKSERLLKIKK